MTLSPGGRSALWAFLTFASTPFGCASNAGGPSSTGASGGSTAAGSAGSGETGAAGTEAKTTGGGGTGGGSTTGSSGATGTGGTAISAGSAGTTGSGGGSGSCAGSLMMCSGKCVDTTGSQANCGTCGHSCRSDQTCWQSTCKCPTGQDDCGGLCKDIMSSNVNCGTCGNACGMGATCTSGQCACPGGQLTCNGACTPVNTDNKNCGKCGTVCGGGTTCSFGACLDLSSLSCPSGGQTGKTATSGASITLGPYWINNNEWGAASGSGSQSIWSTCQNGDLVGWGTSWSWTGNANQVKTYASLVFGWHYGWKNTSTGLPLQLSAGKKVNCAWDFTITQSGGSADVSYDIFLHSLAMPGSNDMPTDEIMIWLYRAGSPFPAGTKMASATLGGTSWDLYRGSTTWNIFSFVRTDNATTATLNVMDFLGDLVSRGWVQSSKYLTSVQSGTEIFTGTGELDTKGYYCRVQ